MKRNVISIGIIGLMILSMIGGCLAEEFVFSFRNGITFGESMESVKSKEAKIRQDNYDPTILRCDRITLSGINDSYIYYVFDNDKLNEIALAYGDEDLDIALKNYDIINEGLIRKYGQPIEDVENATTYKGGAIEFFKSYGEGNADVKEKTLHAKNQWVIEVGEDKKIVIEHILFSYIYQKYGDPETRKIHRTTYQYLGTNTVPTDIIDKDL